MYSNYDEEDVNNANEEIVAQGLQKLGHAASDKVKRGNSLKTPLFCNHPTQSYNMPQMRIMNAGTSRKEI